MSIRFDGNLANYLSRTASVPDYNSPYTIAGWLKVKVDTGVTQAAYALSPASASNSFDFFGPQSSDLYVLSSRVSDGSIESDTGSAVVYDQWVYFAAVRNSATDFRVYLDLVEDAQTTIDVSTRTAADICTVGRLSVNSDAFIPLDAETAYYRIWTTSLSLAEITAERSSPTAVKTTSLFGDYPMVNAASAGNDISGNGNHFTVNGTISTGASEPALGNRRTLLRGRNFHLFDDSEVNRFEFWPAVGAGVSDLQLPLSDDLINLTDALATTIEHRTALADNADILTDGEVRVVGVESSLSDTLASLADAQAQLLTYLLALTDSNAANWADAHQLLLAQFLALSDNAASLDDTTTLRLEQRAVFADTVTLSDVVELQLQIALTLADTTTNLTDDAQPLLTYRLTLTDSDQQFPSTSILDNFNRPNEDPVTGWTKLHTSDNDLRVVSNQLTGPINSRAVFDALTPADDQEVYVGVGAGSTSGGGSGNRFYLLLRITGQTSDNATGYYVLMLAAVVRLYRIDSFFSLEELASFSLGAPLTVGDQLGARVIGNNFEIWANIQGTGWQQVVTATDATYPTGKIGLGVGTLGDELLLDNFGGGSVTSGLRDAFNTTLAGGDNLTLELSDTLTLADSLTLGHGLLSADTLDSLTDAFSIRGDELLETADTLTLADNESHTLDLQLAFDETITLADSRALGHGLGLSETLVLTDDYSQIVSGSLDFSDSLTLTDSLQLGYGLSIDDDANLLVDAVETTAPQGPLREVGLTDALGEFTEAVARELAHVLAVEDSAPSLDDSLTPTLEHLTAFSDTIALTDDAAIILAHEQSLDDVLALADEVQLRLDHELTTTDSLTLTDAATSTLSHELSLSDNAANWADSALQTVGLAVIITDNVDSLTDAIDLFSTGALHFADILALNDSLATFSAGFLSLNDSLLLTDNLTLDLRGPDLDAALTDTLTLADAISLTLSTELQLQLLLSDTITLTDHYFDLRRPYLPSAKRHVVVSSAPRVTVVPARGKVEVPASDRTTRVE